LDTREGGKVRSWRAPDPYNGPIRKINTLFELGIVTFREDDFLFALRIQRFHPDGQFGRLEQQFPQGKNEVLKNPQRSSLKTKE
jgi:hypothetical protein